MDSIWSVAPAQADVDSTRYDMVSQCAAAGQPKLGCEFFCLSL